MASWAINRKHQHRQTKRERAGSHPIGVAFHCDACADGKRREKDQSREPGEGDPVEPRVLHPAALIADSKPSGERCARPVPRRDAKDAEGDQKAGCRHDRPSSRKASISCVWEGTVRPMPPTTSTVKAARQVRDMEAQEKRGGASLSLPGMARLSSPCPPRPRSVRRGPRKRNCPASHRRVRGPRWSLRPARDSSRTGSR